MEQIIQKLKEKNQKKKRNYQKIEKNAKKFIIKKRNLM